MEFYEAINKRRSIRDFTDDTIPEETIKRILDAAYKAPANDHFRDWHFIVVTDKETKLRTLEGIPKKLSVKDVDSMTFISDPVQKECYQEAVPKQYRMLFDTAALIIPLMKKKCDILHPTCLSDLNCYASVWCAIENLWVAAASEGYNCNVRIPLGNEESVAKKALNIPEDYLIPCFMGIGRPAPNAVRTKQFVVDFDRQVHWNGF
ncbi:MAG: nitroreductase family protein [Treponema sp.]|nr:nitroreductase family protein [Treponema sp.]